MIHIADNQTGIFCDKCHEIFWSIENMQYLSDNVC